MKWKKRIINNKFGANLKKLISLILSKKDDKKIISTDSLLRSTENIGKIEAKLNNSKKTAKEINTIKNTNFFLFTNCNEKKKLSIF